MLNVDVKRLLNTFRMEAGHSLNGPSVADLVASERSFVTRWLAGEPNRFGFRQISESNADYIAPEMQGHSLRQMEDLVVILTLHYIFTNWL